MVTCDPKSCRWRQIPRPLHPLVPPPPFIFFGIFFFSLSRQGGARASEEDNHKQNCSRPLLSFFLLRLSPFPLSSLEQKPSMPGAVLLTICIGPGPARCPPPFFFQARVFFPSSPFSHLRMVQQEHWWEKTNAVAGRFLLLPLLPSEVFFSFFFFHLAARSDDDIATSNLAQTRILLRPLPLPQHCFFPIR